MRNKYFPSKTQLFLVATLAAALFFLAGGALFAEENSSAGPQIVGLEGEAYVQWAGAGEWMGVEEKTPLSPGDRLRAGEKSQITLAVNGEDLVEIHENTEFEVEAQEEKEESFSFKLWWGGLVAKIKPSPNKKFRIRTPLAAMSVRGTEFALDVSDEEGDQVAVTEGRVLFQALDQSDQALGEEVEVAQDEGAVVEPGRPSRLAKDLPRRVKKRLVRLALLRKNAPQLQRKWRRLSPEKRREIRQRVKDRWQKLSPKKKEKIRKKINKKRKQALKKRSLKKQSLGQKKKRVLDKKKPRRPAARPKLPRRRP